jgi:hypothetical protein
MQNVHGCPQPEMTKLLSRQIAPSLTTCPALTNTGALFLSDPKAAFHCVQSGYVANGISLVVIRFSGDAPAVKNMVMSPPRSVVNRSSSMFSNKWNATDFASYSWRAGMLASSILSGLCAAPSVHRALL